MRMYTKAILIIFIFFVNGFFEFENHFWQLNAQKQKGQALNAASAQKAIDILKVCLDSI